MRKFLGVLMGGLLLPSVLLACMQGPCIQSAIHYKIQMEDWATTKTAHVLVDFFGTMPTENLMKLQTNVVDQLKKLSASVPWHVVAFNRQENRSGLEGVVITAEARLPSADLPSLRTIAKSMSKPGATFKIRSISFTPSLADIQKTRSILRNKLYQRVQTELSEFNRLGKEAHQHYQINKLDIYDAGAVPLEKQWRNEAVAFKVDAQRQRISESVTQVSRKNLLKVIPASFYSRRLYKEVGQKWQGRGFFYLLVLLAIVLFVVAIRVGISFYFEADPEISFIIQQIPEMNIQNGMITAKPAGPTVIRSQSGTPVFIINTQKVSTQFVNEKLTVSAMIVKDGIVIKKDKGLKTEIQRLSKDFTVTFDASRLEKLYGKLKIGLLPIIAILGYVVSLMFLYAFRLVYGLISTLIGLVFNMFLKRQLSFTHILNISLVAMTPPILVGMVSLLFKVDLPWHSFIFFVWTIAYVFFGIFVNPKRV
jgi:hypothetical protein